MIVGLAGLPTTSRPVTTHPVAAQVDARAGRAERIGSDESHEVPVHEHAVPHRGCGEEHRTADRAQPVHPGGGRRHRLLGRRAPRAAAGPGRDLTRPGPPVRNRRRSGEARCRTSDAGARPPPFPARSCCTALGSVRRLRHRRRRTARPLRQDRRLATSGSARSWDRRAGEATRSLGTACPRSRPSTRHRRSSLVDRLAGVDHRETDGAAEGVTVRRRADVADRAIRCGARARRGTASARDPSRGSGGAAWSAGPRAFCAKHRVLAEEAAFFRSTAKPRPASSTVSVLSMS